MSAFSESRCELTETYSPTAIDIDPATRPATPGDQNDFHRSGRRCDTNHEACRRNERVVGPEHCGAQPRGASASVTLVMSRQRPPIRPRWHFNFGLVMVSIVAKCIENAFY